MEQPENVSLELITPPVEAPPKPLLWSGWATFGLSLAVIFISQVIQALVYLVFIFRRFSEGYILSDPEWLLEQVFSDGLMLSLAILISSAVGIAITLLFIRLRRGYSVAEYLAIKSLNLKNTLMILGILAAVLAFSILVNTWVKSPLEEDLFYAAYQNTPWPALFWLGVVVIGPLFEEVLFRGFFFAGLKQTRLGVVGTIAISAFVFALLHSAQYEPALVAQIFVLGAVLGIVRWKTGTLWSSILLHGLWNLSQMIMIAYLAPAGS